MPAARWENARDGETWLMELVVCEPPLNLVEAFVRLRLTGV